MSAAIAACRACHGLNVLDFLKVNGASRILGLWLPFFEVAATLTFLSIQIA